MGGLTRVGWTTLLIFGGAVAQGAVFKPQRPQEHECSFLCERIPQKNELLTSFGSASQGHLEPDRIRVLVWNIYKGRKEDFGTQFRELSRDSDLVLLQEMNTDMATMDTVQERGDLLWEMTTSFFTTLGWRTGVATGSSSRPKSITGLQTSDREPFVNSPKVVTITEYALEGRSEALMVANIHGMNFRMLSGLKHQVEPVLEIIRKHEGPVLFAGDFNTKTSARIDWLEQAAAQVGLKTVDWENPEAGKILGAHLDHAFVRGLGVRSARILDGLTGSDHPALSLDLRVNP